MRIEIKKKFGNEGKCCLQQKEISYRTITEELTFFDGNGDAEATCYTISYERTDCETAGRPILFAYNGGPGSSSSTIHIGALAPWRVNIGDEVLNFTPPFEIEENPDTILDICDIVLIDPVGCGFARLLKEEAASKYYCSDGDAVTIVQIMNQWITAHKRWNAPLFIMGESYGTIRNALVAEKLFYNEGPGLCNCNLLHLSGIIMLGTALDHGQTPFPVDTAVLNFTSIAASYWLHHLKDEVNLESFLEEASEFAYREYLPVLALGRRVSAEEKEAVLQKLQYFTGMDRDSLISSELRVETGTYPLLGSAKEGYRLSRYDGRFRMEPIKDISNYDMFGDDAVSSMVLPALTHGFNGCLKEKLGIETNDLYEVLNIDVSERWNFRTSKPPIKSLESAMKKNPNLKVMFGTGYFDMVTTIGYTEYLVNRSELPKERIKMEAYESGHMPYLGKKPAKKFGKDLRDFIKWSLE